MSVVSRYLQSYHAEILVSKAFEGSFCQELNLTSFSTKNNILCVSLKYYLYFQDTGRVTMQRCRYSAKGWTAGYGIRVHLARKKIKVSQQDLFQLVVCFFWFNSCCHLMVNYVEVCAPLAAGSTCTNTLTIGATMHACRTCTVLNGEEIHYLMLRWEVRSCVVSEWKNSPRAMLDFIRSLLH